MAYEHVKRSGVECQCVWVKGAAHGLMDPNATKLVRKEGADEAVRRAMVFARAKLD